jgi:hypothetical protein
LPVDVPLLLFGAMGGGLDPRKGFGLLSGALEYLRGEVPALELVIFGELAPRNPPDLDFPIHYTGHLHDGLSLRALYSAADALVGRRGRTICPTPLSKPRPAVRPWLPSTSAACRTLLSTSLPDISPRRLMWWTWRRVLLGYCGRT